MTIENFDNKLLRYALALQLTVFGLLNVACKKESSPTSPSIVEINDPTPIYNGIMWKDVRNVMTQKGYSFQYYPQNTEDKFNPTIFEVYDNSLNAVQVPGNYIDIPGTTTLCYILNNPGLNTTNITSLREILELSQIPTFVIDNADKNTPEQNAQLVLANLIASGYVQKK